MLCVIHVHALTIIGRLLISKSRLIKNLAKVSCHIIIIIHCRTFYYPLAYLFIGLYTLAAGVVSLHFEILVDRHGGCAIALLMGKPETGLYAYP